MDTSVISANVCLILDIICMHPSSLSLSVCLLVLLFACMHVRIYACLTAYMKICMSVWLSAIICLIVPYLYNNSLLDI